MTFNKMKHYSLHLNNVKQFTQYLIMIKIIFAAAGCGLIDDN